MLTIQPIKAAETYHLRHTVLRPNQTIDDCKYAGDDDPTTIHLGAFFNGKIISIGTFLQASHSLLEAKYPYQLRGMATDAQFRGQKGGSSIILRAEKLLRDKGSDLLWCNARISAKDYYARLGFQEVGEVFEISPIGLHVVMFKQL
jgi:predicted GNAT family N-acyltransferase